MQRMILMNATLYADHHDPQKPIGPEEHDLSNSKLNFTRGG
jgi:hypothetical protein